ncbi:MAG: hypothetical protein E7384_00255 [Ruminococcaceae bacterium]|nr:hypothetical protein [Oscillospiraceae bacterium]
MIDLGWLQNFVDRHQNDETYFPVVSLFYELIWANNYYIDQDETEWIRLHGEDYFKYYPSKTEALYRKCHNVYRKFQYPEIQDIFEEVEAVFIDKFPSRWADVYMELESERLKNVPKPSSDGTTYHEYIPNPPFKTSMVDWRTNKPVYLQDGNYVDENGEHISFVYID